MMSNNRRSFFMLISGLVVIGATLLLFFLLTEESVMIDWLGLTFILMGEVALFGGLLAIEKASSSTQEVMFRSGTYMILIICTAASIMISIVFMAFLRENVKILTALQVLILVSEIIYILSIVQSSKSVEEQNLSVEESASKLRGLAQRASLLAQYDLEKKHQDLLENVYEDIRFCDISVTVPLDDEIDVKLAELEKILQEEVTETGVIQDVAEEIIQLVKRRTVEVKTLKTGKI